VHLSRKLSPHLTWADVLAGASILLTPFSVACLWIADCDGAAMLLVDLPEAASSKNKGMDNASFNHSGPNTSTTLALPLETKKTSISMMGKGRFRIR
jgi:hypothetical protein